MALQEKKNFVLLKNLIQEKAIDQSSSYVTIHYFNVTPFQSINYRKFSENYVKFWKFARKNRLRLGNFREKHLMIGNILRKKLTMENVEKKYC